jgi:hypothetical protein
VGLDVTALLVFLIGSAVLYLKAAMTSCAEFIWR